MQRDLDFELLSGFMRFLYRNRDREIILMELLNLLEKKFDCSAAAAYLLEYGLFMLKAKINDWDFSDAGLAPDNVLGADFLAKYQKNENCRPILMQNDFYLIILQSGQEVMGFLVFRRSDVLSEATDMISILATQAAIALKEGEMYTDRKVIEQVVADFSLDMKIHYPRFVQNLRRVVNFDRLSITIPDPLHPDKLLVYGNNVNDPLETITLAYEGTAPAWVVSTGEPILEEDLNSSKMFPEDEYLFKSGIRCALRVPLMSKGEVIGTINICSRIPYSYKKRHIDLIMEVADRIGPIVENALVYESVNNNLGQALFELEQNFYATLNAFTYLLERRDNGTKGHSLRVIRYSVMIAEHLGIEEEEIERLRLGALLHDIGKIGIPDAILLKTEPLTGEEWKIMKTHPMLGAETLAKINFLSPAVPVVLHHHERFDGTGYPSGLSGEEIPLAARIFSIADAFDAITSQRPYKDIQSVDKAIEELKRCTGTQFCPECMGAFLNIPKKELLEIYKECKNETAFKNPYVIGQEFRKRDRNNFNADIPGPPSKETAPFLLTS